MRSAALADLAGVTVRTLRHYHQTGLLPEPPRRANGYREYTVHDLIRVLRIRRLAALGIALERMPDLLDDDTSDIGTTLEALDAELASQIARLSAQRTVIAQLRAHGSAPDLPPELAPFLAVFAAAPLPPDALRQDRDQAILIAHLAGEAGMPHLAGFYERISAPDIAEGVTEASRRFAELGPPSTDAEIAATADLIVATVLPLLDDLAAGAVHDAVAASAELITEYLEGALTPQQRDCIARTESMLAAHGRSASTDDRVV